MRRIWVLTKQTWFGYLHDNCSQNAAAISYYALFSIAPTAILIVSILGLVLDESQRANLVDRILEVLPLSETEGRDSVEEALESVRDISGPVAFVALVGTLWTSSAMFGCVRRSLNVVWRVEEHRPYFRAKAIDFAQVGVMSCFLLASIMLTAVLRTAREVSSDWFGPLGGENPLWELPPLFAPAVLSFTAFMLLFRYVPAAHPRWRDVLPGAIMATVLFEVLKNGFAFYVANYNNFDVVYGSLAGALLLMLNIYLASIILLVGAELAHTFERYHAGQLEQQIHPEGPGTPIAVQAVRAVKGLFVRERPLS